MARGSAYHKKSNGKRVRSESGNYKCAEGYVRNKRSSSKSRCLKECRDGFSRSKVTNKCRKSGRSAIRRERRESRKNKKSKSRSKSKSKRTSKSPKVKSAELIEIV